MIDTIWDVLKHGAGFVTTSRHKERVYQWHSVTGQRAHRT